MNSTDKLLQKIQVTEPLVDNKNTEQPLLSDLERKFRCFREQVENEIASLHLEKNMYEEKYTKLFDLILQTKKGPNLETTGTMTSDMYSNLTTRTGQQTSIVEKATVDDATQTEQVKSNNLEQKTVQRLSIEAIQDRQPHNKDLNPDNSDKLEEKLSTLSGEIDNKVYVLYIYIFLAQRVSCILI